MEQNAFLWIAGAIGLVLLATLVTWKVRGPIERKYVLSRRTRELLSSKTYSSMTYAEICLFLNVTDPKERDIIFGELMILTNEGKVATERWGPQLYYIWIAQQ